MAGRVMSQLSAPSSSLLVVHRTGRQTQATGCYVLHRYVPVRMAACRSTNGNPGAPGESELDIEVLRVALFREGWQCLAEADAEACILPEPGRGAPDARAGRARAADLAGEWKVLDVTGVPITEADALTGARGRRFAKSDRGLAIFRSGAGLSGQLRMTHAADSNPSQALQ